ncbi:MAG: PhnD/SsuA/transferrin family substrate-binding protein [Dehalococcoidia bacterium]|nr:MAG: PhnD/SsuA/transferrin family substrate-binding protein [Dehalococcoidia bacterium]
MKKRSWFLILIPIAVMIGYLSFTLNNGPKLDAITIDLNEKVNVPQSQQDIYIPDVETSENSLRIAISGILSPSKALEYYQELLTYVGQKLNKEIKLILRPTYAEINDLVENQLVDLAFVCTLAYVEGREKFGMEILAAPEMYGETVYYSYLIVPSESIATSINDLKNTRFAFTDPMSNTGHLAPVYNLSLIGETPILFFDNYIFTYNHDVSVFTVANNLVDGAAVDSLVYDQLIENNPNLADNTKIIEIWGPYGIPPVVVNPAMDSQLKRELQELFLSIHRTTEGVSLLNDLDIDKFVLVPDDIYDSIRQMRQQLGE